MKIDSCNSFKINMFCPINMLGYGIHSMNYLYALQKANFDIGFTPIGQIQCADQNFVQSLNRKFDKNIPSIMIFHETHMNQFHGKPRIGFPVFETSLIDDFSKTLLEQLDYIFVTSEWAKMILGRNNINTDKVFVIREGINPDIYKISNDKHIDTGKLTYITVGKHEVRKNTDMILESFIDSFRDKNVALISHTFNPFTNKFGSFDPFKVGFMIDEETNQYIKYSYADCDIYFTKPMMNKDLSSLYNSADIGIFTSRCEGWNLPLSESLACGIPSICCYNTAQMEYLEGLKSHQDNLIIEGFTEEIAEDGIWFHSNKGTWFTMSDSQLKSKLLYSYENYNKFNKEDISKYMHENFAWEKTAQRTLDAFKSIGV